MGLVADGGMLHLAHVLPATASAAADPRRARERAWYALSRLVGGDGIGEREASCERHVLEGSPAEQLLALADRVGADLIVLGTCGRSVVGRILGSVALSVTEGAKAPVLLVPLPPS